MKKFNLLLVLILLVQISALAQTPRQDVIWARTVPAGTITLDGILNEPAWNQAESINLKYGVDAGLPTSGWKAEFQPGAITDPTNAVIKFLIQGNQLFLSFVIPDSSIGGSDWPRWDGILMSVKDAKNRDPLIKFASAAEYFYAWYTVGLPNPAPVVGSKPRFIGKFGNFTDTTRTPEQRDAWDAVTIVKGTANDNLRDTSWTVEMKVDLTVLGYDVTKPEGDIVLLNFSIWDCDYLFEGNASRISTTRTHYQSPWGNANSNNVARLFARPDIGLTSTLPVVSPEVNVPSGAQVPDPVIDGKLYEPVWSGAYTFNLGFNDSLVRATYPGAGKLMSGQYQPELFTNPRPPVLDPSKGTIKMFFKGNYLYLGADVTDQIVQGTEVYDQIDGVGFIIGHRISKNEENVMEFKLLRVNFNNLGNPTAYDYLPVLQDSLGAEWQMSLKGTTTINVNTDVDSGYSVEMKIDLTKLGYPSGLGDRLLFMGVMLADGDSFDDSLNNYGTRAWWFREHAGGPTAAWMYMDPNLILDVNDKDVTTIPSSLQLYGNYPNPFNPTTKIKYSIPSEGNITLTVYNSLGEEISKFFEQNKTAGVYEQNFIGNNLSSGIYFYKIHFESVKNSFKQELSGKMILLK